MPQYYNVHLEGQSVQTEKIRSSEMSGTITSRLEQTFHKTLIFSQVAVYLMEVMIHAH
jgi:hypothetical protein